MIFKSFDQFITESTLANLVSTNENFSDKFKVMSNQTQRGEIRNLSFRAVIDAGNPPPTEAQIRGEAKKFAQDSLSNSEDFKAGALAMDANGKDPAAVIFIKEKTLKQRAFNGRIIFEADLYFKSSSSYKSSAEIQTMIDDGDIKPYMIVNTTNVNYKNINIWDISDMGSLIKGSSSDETNPAVVNKEETKTAEEKEKEKKALADAEAAKKNNNLGPTKKAEAVVGAAAFPAVNGTKLRKKGEPKSEEILKLQKMIMAGAIANTTDPKYKTAADAIKNSGGADGKYGGQTALAIGTLLDVPNTKISAITTSIEDGLKAALSKVTDANIKTIEASAAKKTTGKQQTNVVRLKRP
jgi:hypothetical protein